MRIRVFGILLLLLPVFLFAQEADAGETEEEFAQSLAFAREMQMAKVHVFAYSRRPGTVAYNMPGQVTNAVKEARSHALIEATEETPIQWRSTAPQLRTGQRWSMKGRSDRHIPRANSASTAE